MKDELVLLRKKIESIDSQIYALLDERERYVHKIQENKICSHTHLFDPHRETMCYQVLQDTKRQQYSHILKEIISYAKEVQGVIYYVLSPQDILFAKLAFGFSSTVLIAPPSHNHQRNASLYYIPNTEVHNFPHLYSHAFYYIHRGEEQYHYHAMSYIPSTERIEFTVNI